MSLGQVFHEDYDLLDCLGNWAVFYTVVSTQGNLCFLILIEGTFSPAGLRFGGILKVKTMEVIPLQIVVVVLLLGYIASRLNEILQELKKK